MKILLICTGSELLRGSVLNRNMQQLGELLFDCGMPLEAEWSIADSYEAIKEALQLAAARYELIIMTGGLGPTSDDLTRQAIADAFGRRLERDESLVELLQQRLKSFSNSTLSANQLLQTMIPAGAEILHNSIGTASGFKLETARCTLFALPGPPREALPMAELYLKPFVEQAAAELNIITEKFFLADIGESRVEAKVIELLEEYPEIIPAYCAEPRLVKLFLSYPDSFDFSCLRQELCTVFKDNLLGPELSSLEAELIALLNRNNYTLAVAESCTGGGLGERLTSVSGASEVFHGGVISYSNVVKERELAVPCEVISEHGAVSSECAAAMVRGVQQRFNCDCAISVSGIAGPGGGSEAKPVGTVFIAVACKEKLAVKKYCFRGGRESVRFQSCCNAFADLRRIID